LADFQSHISAFDQKRIKVIAASPDSLEDARKSVERKKLTFPIAYGLDARAFAAMTGAFFDDVRGYLQAKLKKYNGSEVDITDKTTKDS
jgi:peroxiredoxin